MAVSFSQQPAYPVPDRSMRIQFTLTDGNYVRVFVTDAPRDSVWFEKLSQPNASQLLIHAGDADDDWTFIPDASGKFVFSAQDITRGATDYGGGYEDSTDGYQNITINATTAGLEIVIGSKLEMTIGTGEDTGTLRLWVWDDTIRATNVATHGEITPGIFDTSSERAENAARSANVVTYLAALADDSTTFALTPTIESTLNDIITNFGGSTAANDDHLDENQDGQVHNVNDSDNNISTAFLNADNPDRVAASASELWTKLDQHMRNDAVSGGVSSGTGSGNYHNVAGNVADYLNALVTKPPGSMAESINTIADCWRAYEAHRIHLTYHAVADTRNPASNLPPLLEPFRYFFVALALTSPTAGDTDNPGAKHLAAAGMTEL